MNSQLVVLVAMLALTAAMPRSVPVPLEQLAPSVRLARHAEPPEQHPLSASRRYQRQGHGYGRDKVNNGAYKGKRGKSGWYQWMVDYPIFNYGSH